MAFDFPATPSEGQSFAPPGGPIYTFQSGVWRASAFDAQVPIGSIIYMPGNAAPINYLKANGVLLSRTAYAELWAYALASGALFTEAQWMTDKCAGFSSGDLSSNFRIPDDRGAFPRGLDDGRGLDAARPVGSYQVDNYLNHAHIISRIYGYFDMRTDNAGNDIAYAGGGVIGIGSGGSVARENCVFAAAAGATRVVTDYTPIASASTTGGAETRPKNNARLACIRYQ